MEICATVSIWVELLATWLYDQAGERQEHVRDLAEFWAAAVEKLGAQGETGSLGPGASDTTNAAATAVEEPVGEARLLGIAQYRRGLLVKLGFLGPEQTTRLAPTIQQLQKLLVKLGILGSPSTVPRQNPI